MSPDGLDTNTDEYSMLQVVVDRKSSGPSSRSHIAPQCRKGAVAVLSLFAVVETGELVTIAWPGGEATFPPECLRRA
jgi:hypothetical protein